jgi:hypothetical protein
MDIESYSSWEAHAIDVLADERRLPEDALARLAQEVELLRTWTPGAGPLAAHVAAIIEIPDVSSTRYPDPVAGIEEVLAAVPAELRPTSLAEDAAAVADTLVGPAWPSLARPLRHYLAGRLFGSWIAYQGRGLRTVVRYLATALALVRHEATRACAAARQPLDRERLVGAIRAADDLLMHRADSLELARRLSRIEDATP